MISKAILFACLIALSYQLGFPRKFAPNFKGSAVFGDKFIDVSLDQYKGQYLVLLFYPFDFTYVCPTELIAFSDANPEFEKINAKILGVSVDSKFTHLAWLKLARNQGGLGKINYPLFADVSKDLSRDYGVLIEDPEDGLYGASLRGLFIIDGTGKIRHVQVNDEQVGRSVDETLRLIKAFQYAEEHGEVCPANWQPGSATIIPDQEKMKIFFKNEYEAEL